MTVAKAQADDVPLKPQTTCVHITEVLYPLTTGGSPHMHTHTNAHVSEQAFRPLSQWLFATRRQSRVLCEKEADARAWSAG